MDWIEVNIVTMPLLADNTHKGNYYDDSKKIRSSRCFDTQW